MAAALASSSPCRALCPGPRGSELTAVLTVGNEVPVGRESVLQRVFLFVFGGLFLLLLFFLFFILILILAPDILDVLDRKKDGL